MIKIIGTLIFIIVVIIIGAIPFMSGILYQIVAMSFSVGREGIINISSNLAGR